MAERQMETVLSDVRADHTARYHWAAQRLSGRILDAACGCGYGSAILADAGLSVVAVDVSEDAIEHAAKHWSRPGIEWLCADVTAMTFPPADAAVSFETIEHLPSPLGFLQSLREAAPRLLASVPNEAVIPFAAKPYPFHFRHYTRGELEELLRAAGWVVERWWGQKGKRSPVGDTVSGRTIVVEARRG